MLRCATVDLGVLKYKKVHVIYFVSARNLQGHGQLGVTHLNVVEFGFGLLSTGVYRYEEVTNRFQRSIPKIKP